MSDAPERIWADGNAEWDSGSWGLDKEFDNDVEYVRADRIEELEADLRKMALDYLAAEGQAAEAYQAQLEAEDKLANLAHAVWTEHKDWEGERKYALRQIVKWIMEQMK
jgi:hypothetical protein